MLSVHCVIHSKRTTTPNPRGQPPNWEVWHDRVRVAGLFGSLMVVSVVIAVGKRPVSFRTRKLSPPAPMVLHSGGWGGGGPRRTKRTQAGPAPIRGRPSPAFVRLPPSNFER